MRVFVPTLVLSFIGIVSCNTVAIDLQRPNVDSPTGTSLQPRRRIATDLPNPRGLLPLPAGGLLVALAGTGVGNSGTLVELRDRDGDGLIAGDDESTRVLDKIPSANAIHIVRRDEVFGAAAIARGNGDTLATVAFFGGPSQVLRIDGGKVEPWGKAHGNLNSLAYHPEVGAWFAVSSTSDEILRLKPGKGAERVVKLPTLNQGQDPVPGYIRYDPSDQRLLISLFSGSVAGEEGGDGTELVEKAGKVVALSPQSGHVETIVDGLTTPTDILVDGCGGLFVLELCDGFEDPADSVEELGRISHGGFRRFSGRLLRVNRATGEIRVLAQGLDTPTNLARRGSTLYISGGMGTPGRMIPGPDGPTPLVGYIDRIDLGEDLCSQPMM